MSDAQQTALEYHRGGDYAVVMRPEDTTDNAIITIRADTDEEADSLGAMIVAAPKAIALLKRMIGDRAAWRFDNISTTEYELAMRHNINDAQRIIDSLEGV